MAQAKIESLVKKLATTQKSLEETRADLVVVTDQKERGIDAYMENTEFKELMEDHDALTHPISFKEGWDEAIKSILKAHPGTFEASAFSCPLASQPSKAVAAKAARLFREGGLSESDDSSGLETEEAEVIQEKKTLSPLVEFSSEGESKESSEESESSSEEEPTKKKQKTAKAPGRV